jgi:hypothetical protein
VSVREFWIARKVRRLWVVRIGSPENMKVLVSQGNVRVLGTESLVRFF